MAAEEVSADGSSLTFHISFNLSELHMLQALTTRLIQCLYSLSFSSITSRILEKAPLLIHLNYCRL